MKSYPSITYKLMKSINIYAFDKLDGSNIRAEWNTKQGFHKFGTRKRLLDESDEQFGSVITLINGKYEDHIRYVFNKNKIGRAICFFEYWGENSFAGNHEDEPHTATLIDVNPYKKGIMGPNEFLKNFGYMDIPRLLYHGKVNLSFIDSVRSGKLDGMTFEGVVCKCIHKNQLKMFKIKSIEWISKVKGIYGNDKKMLRELIDESELDFVSKYYHRRRRFCPSCFKNGSLSNKCICGSKTLDMEFEAQPPRKNAKKGRWKNFFKMWYPDMNFDIQWKLKNY